ncbi:MAG: cupin domain-containing protein [Chitinophagaceae bacterium]
MNRFLFTVPAPVEQLCKERHQKFTVLLQHHSMQLEYFDPQITDTQTPHRKDEIYVIASGHSDFYRDGQTVLCKQRDLLFVPAGIEHRFQNFSPDFGTCVIFYGLNGGGQP